MSAVFGIDAAHAEALFDNGFLCVDLARGRREGTLSTFRSIRAEDVVFIKQFTPQSGLYVSAAGVALSDHSTEIGAYVCVPVRWVWRGEKRIEAQDEQLLHGVDACYKEHNITVQREIIELAPHKLQLPQAW
jgi:hypothetical protein